VKHLARLGALAAAALLGACSLSTDDEPQAIEGPVVESSASSQASTSNLPDADAENVSVWFLQNRASGVGAFLVEGSRKVAFPASPETWLDALLQQPPDSSEKEDGFWSAIPVDAQLVSTPEQSGHVLTVQLPNRVYEDLHGLIAQYALAQIVFTATEIPGVESVQFLRDDGVFAAIDGTGQARTDPLGRDDFVDVMP
jgi:spore germination protein GerM